MKNLTEKRTTSFSRESNDKIWLGKLKKTAQSRAETPTGASLAEIYTYVNLKFLANRKVPIVYTVAKLNKGTSSEIAEEANQGINVVSAHLSNLAEEKVLKTSWERGNAYKTYEVADDLFAEGLRKFKAIAPENDSKYFNKLRTLIKSSLQDDDVVVFLETYTLLKQKFIGKRQREILTAVAVLRESTPTEIANYTGIPQENVSAQLTQLVKTDFVNRDFTPEVGRKKVYRITDKLFDIGLRYIARELNHKEAAQEVREHFHG